MFDEARHEAIIEQIEEDQIKLSQIKDNINSLRMQNEETIEKATALKEQYHRTADSICAIDKKACEHGDIKRVLDEVYVVKLQIKNSTMTLDIGQHIKDDMNKVIISVPVDRQYYNSLSVGQEISETTRMGSALISGKFGSTIVTVIEKRMDYR